MDKICFDYFNSLRDVSRENWGALVELPSQPNKEKIAAFGNPQRLLFPVTGGGTFLYNDIILHQMSIPSIAIRLYLKSLFAILIYIGFISNLFVAGMAQHQGSL